MTVGELEKYFSDRTFFKDPKPFPSKTDIPMCILNLVLEKHGLRLEREEG